MPPATFHALPTVVDDLRERWDALDKKLLAIFPFD